MGDTLGDILRDTVIQVRHDDRKLVSVRTECRALILSVVDLRLVAVQNFPKAAALALHVAQTVEHIGQHRVTPSGRHGQRVAVLDHRPVRHTARRVDLQTVIVDVNVDLAAVDEIIAVRQRVDKRLVVAALDVFGQFLPRVGCFAPHHAGVALDERLAILNQREHTAGILGIVQRVHCAAAFVQPIPACAEQP